MIIPVGGRIIDFKFYNTVGGTWTRPERCTAVIVVGIGGGGGGGRFSTGIGSNSTGGTSTSFGTALVCGGGSGGGNDGQTAGANGTVSGSAAIIQNISSVRSIFNLMGYGQGGMGAIRIQFDNAPFFTLSRITGNMGGNGGFGVAYIKTNLLDSYAVTLGTGGSGAVQGSYSVTADNGRNGALLVIELGD